ncbi:SAM-dependent methyltransferase [Nonomuraea phyllanthi]|uniref:SAM-dependent methyltransferase n=1 Tax=Nonomuraea phyllanthi TaxID=2219224 RepID=A0A5C4WQR2_9ACTN|nr:SAM-dependent methyltransferase [Nonomuraea phyllanthi]KAB8195965.1 SAM-dependent methyltransferase [Nonomuraea phyllanthi]QFY07419.1 SAM-dependent methyltransferase [Nonomuraea phyllanthi]
MTAPHGINPNIPHSARVYDYWLGGKDNFEADRRVAEQTLAAVPSVRESARNNRAFLGRAVRHLTRLGIRQFLDLGTGIPTQGNTHEVAQAEAPDARVVYVDNDPIVMTHARALLTSTPEGRTAYIEADAREPGAVLDHPDVRATLDFTQPIGLVMVAILMHIADEDDPAGLVKAYADALAPGSYLVLSHLTLDLAPKETTDAYLAATSRQAMHRTPRTGEQIARYFDGFDLVEPGLVAVSEWHDTPLFPDSPAWMYAGVGRKR